MKQATLEGFIRYVLTYNAPVEGYYKLVNKIESDTEFDTKRAKKKFRRCVETGS